MTGGRVMILEADRRLRESRSRALAREGYQVTGVSAFDRAVELSRDNGFDLFVIVDTDETELLNMRLAQLPPDAGMLIITDDETVKQVIEQKGPGIRSFLTRPFTLERFGQAVTQAIDRAATIRESIRGEALSSLDSAGPPSDSSEELNDFFSHVVRTGAADTGARFVALYLKDAASGAVFTRATVGDAPQEWQHLCQQVSGGRETVLFGESTPRHPLTEAIAEAGVAALLSVPLSAHGETVGAICFLKPLPESGFSPADQSLASILARWSGLALENTRLASHVQRQYGQVEKLLHEVSVAQENERRRVAMEIHDGVAQWMVGASYSIKACSTLIAESRLPDLERELASTRKTIQRSIRELRRAIADLRPLPLEEMGLATAIRQAAETLRQDDIHCTTLVEGTLPPLTPPEENTTYWIVQEILTNIRKHSEATRVDLHIQFRDSTFSVVVKDNGRGFDVSGVVNSDSTLAHMGLVGMKERAELVGGHLTVESGRGRGTVIRFSFPVDARDGARAAV